MSFSLTTPQFRARSKNVTRRLRWINAKVGDRVMGVEKGMGLKKCETVVRLGVIEFTEVRRERLSDMTKMPVYGNYECQREGFSELTPAGFVKMFCKHNKCTPRKVITRIAFRYID